MRKRLSGATGVLTIVVVPMALVALVVVVPLLAATATVAVAAEEEAPAGEAPAEEEGHGSTDIDEIGTDVARSEFFPDEYVSPTWFQWVLYPTIIIAVVMALGLLLYYLFRQPSFAEERQKSAQR